MKKTSVRVLSALLVLLMVVPMLFACGDTPEETTEKPEETQAPAESESESESETLGGEIEDPQQTLDLIKGGKSEFTLVIGRYAQFINDKAAYMIQDAIKKISGVEMPFSKDYDLFLNSLDLATRSKYELQASYEASGGVGNMFADLAKIEASYDRSAPYEILIGDTDRAESAAAIADLKGENEYILRIDGNKIVLVASSNQALIAGAEYFISEYLSAESADLTIEDLKKSATVEVAPPEENPEVFFGMTQDEVDAAFADVLNGLFTGETKEIFELEHMGADIEMQCSDILYVDGVYYSYYNRLINSDSGHKLFGKYWMDWANASDPAYQLAFITSLAKSEDGRNWTYVKDVAAYLDPETGKPLSSVSNFSGIWKDEDGIMYHVYEHSYGTVAGYVHLNVSFDDGETWINEGAILTKSQFPSWCNGNIGTPDIYRKDGVWYVTFHGFGSGAGNGGCQIGVAYGGNLRNLETLVQDPVIPTEKDTPWSGTTGERDIFYCDGYYYMVYEVSTEAVAPYGYGSAMWTHMFARSRDMINWEHTAAPQHTAPHQSLWNDQPGWIVIDGELYVISNNVQYADSFLVRLEYGQK